MKHRGKKYKKRRTRINKRRNHKRAKAARSSFPLKMRIA
jgi:hypothetical protein